MSRLPSHRCALIVLSLGAAPFALPSAARGQRAATAEPRTFPSDSVILAILKQRVEEKRSAGIVVGVVEPSGRTRIVAFGDPGPGQPALDGNSVFEIGSITKVFTATVLAKLVQEGKVKLDDPVQQYLPPAAKMPTRNGKQITLGSLSDKTPDCRGCRATSIRRTRRTHTPIIPSHRCTISYLRTS